MEGPTIAQRKPVVMTLEPGTHYWCRCGRSQKQPFCDGAHAGTGFQPMMFEITEAKQAAICQCKHTKNPPYCDGAHRNLPPV